MSSSIEPVAAVAAVLRSASPGFREGHPADRLAFAAHACVLAAGYRLVASGSAAASPASAALLDRDRAHPPTPAEAPDAALAADWNASGDGDDDEYTFLYAPEEEQEVSEAKRRMLLLKCLLLGGGGGDDDDDDENGSGRILVATLAPGGGPSAPAAPQTVELPLAQFVDAGAGAASGTPSVAGVRNLPELVARVREALTRATPPAAGGVVAGAGAAAAGEAAAGGSGRRADNGDDDDNDYDPLRVGPRMRPGRGDGLRVGEEDVMPLGIGGGGGFGGGGGGLGGGGLGGGPPLGPGGGMHVGPHHPFFADRQRHQPPGGLPPGARWDPIRPEGLEGWSPDDFVRPPGEGGGGRGGGGVPPGGGRGRGGPGGGGGRVHPDIMPPGPGGGANWDSMFG
jgi:hypothetical protein